MKKILSIILALTLVLGLAVIANAAEQTTVTKQMSSYGWANESQHKSVALDSVVTATMAGTDQNTGKYYNSGTNWRMYETGNATLTISAKDETIISVKLTFTLEKNAKLYNGTAVVSSNQVVEVNASSVTFSVRGGDSGKGQARISAIQVVYGEAGGSAPACEHEYTNEYDAICNKCETVSREVSLPAAESAVTYAQAAKLAAAGVTTEYKVTGVVDEVYNTTYGNMYIKDAEGNKFTVYGCYSADGSTRYDSMTDKPAAGDTITVLGAFSIYSGATQMKNGKLVSLEHPAPAGCTEHAYTNEYDATCNNAGCTEGNRTVTLPDANSVITFEQADKLALAGVTDVIYKLTGEITEIYNEEYGNMYIKDANGTIITIYGTFDATGENRFDAMATKPAVGDTITVSGKLSTYNGKGQMKNGWILEIKSATEGDEPAQTGDMTPVIGLVALAVLSCAAFVTLAAAKKRAF